MDARTRSPRFVAQLFQPVDGASLFFVRVAFGLVVLWEVWRYLDKGWIASFYIRPEFYFKYYGFEWVRPWRGNGMYVHFGVLAVFALMVAPRNLRQASWIRPFDATAPERLTKGALDLEEE